MLGVKQWPVQPQPKNFQFSAEVGVQFFWHFPNSVVSLAFRLDRNTDRDFRWMAITRWSKDRPCADFVG